MGRYADLALVICLVFLASFSFAAGFFLSSDEQIITNNVVKFSSDELKASASVAIAAIDSNGDGLISTLTAEIRSGEGRILVNIGNVQTGYDTQQSAIIAVMAAREYLSADFSNVDIIFTIESNAVVVSGPSAGAAMATALVMAIEEKPVGPVVITGTVYANGSIGQVDGVLAKAIAARRSGADLFLVPLGQAVIQDCSSGVCEFINLEAEAHIDVEEVSSLADVIAYFYSVAA